jgi:hypothetical protein
LIFLAGSGSALNNCGYATQLQDILVLYISAPCCKKWREERRRKSEQVDLTSSGDLSVGQANGPPSQVCKKSNTLSIYYIFYKAL